MALSSPASSSSVWNRSLGFSRRRCQALALHPSLGPPGISDLSMECLPSKLHFYYPTLAADPANPQGDSRAGPSTPTYGITRGATIHLDTTVHREPIGATAAWKKRWSDTS